MASESDPPAAATLDESDEDEAVSSSADDCSESDSVTPDEHTNGSGAKAKKASQVRCIITHVCCTHPLLAHHRRRRSGRKRVVQPMAALVPAPQNAKPLTHGAVAVSPSVSMHHHRHHLCGCRFQEAMQLLSANDEDGMWVKLSNCFLQDAKVAKLCEAMANNTHVTSIDLSSNCLTNTAARVLAAALTDKANAPDLILLDVRGNPIDDEALDALVRVWPPHRYIPCSQASRVVALWFSGRLL